jgi:hypothetical protein
MVADDTAALAMHPRSEKYLSDKITLLIKKIPKHEHNKTLTFEKYILPSNSF